MNNSQRYELETKRKEFLQMEALLQEKMKELEQLEERIGSTALESNRCFIYTRVSTPRQAESGLSYMENIRQGLEYAEQNGFDPGEPMKISFNGSPPIDAAERVYVDAESAYKTEFGQREAGGRLLLDIDFGDHLIIPKLDRAFRRVKDAQDTVNRLDSRKVTVHFIDIGVSTADPMGRFFIDVLTHLASWESRRRGERIADAHRARKARGEPLGFQPERNFKVIKEEGRFKQEVCEKSRALSRLFYRWYYDHNLTVNEIRQYAYLFGIKDWARGKPSAKRNGIDRFGPDLIMRMIKAEEKFLELEEEEGEVFTDNDAGDAWLASKCGVDSIDDLEPHNVKTRFSRRRNGVSV